MIDIIISIDDSPVDSVETQIRIDGVDSPTSAQVDALHEIMLVAERYRRAFLEGE